MTRRKAPAPRVDPDEFGFDLVGDEFNVQPQELMCLIGLDALAVQLYFMCLRPFADRKSGDVHFASYYRFIHRLSPVSSRRGGPRLPVPTKQMLRDALTRLAQAGAVKLFPKPRAASALFKFASCDGLVLSRPTQLAHRLEHRPAGRKAA